ncbi:MAG: 50S ribosomal protein L13 [Bdellovibrionales bacterium]|nr:50S ribosomal protein L13 [Bdellovibrionales bacterium]
MKTWNAKDNEVERKWWVIDATDQTLGRLASETAKLLRGKHKPQFTPHVDTGDFVIITNTDKIRMTGKKWVDKTYFSRSRYFGSIKEKSAGLWLKRDSTFLVHEAVKGMLPKTKLGYGLITKLKTFKDASHPHAAQKPSAYTLAK